jgi:multiple sugar transport system permease protein
MIGSSPVMRVLNYVLMIFLSFFFLFPVILMVVSSVKPDQQITNDMRSLDAFLPTNFTTENFTCPDYDQEGSICSPRPSQNPGLFERLPFVQVFANTVIITIFTVVLSLLVNSMAAFALSRLEFPGRKLLITLVIALIIIPFEAIAVPLLRLVVVFDWTNTYHVQVIPFVANAFSIFLMYQFFIDIPKDFDEAALVDGASYFRIYWQVILPLARPVLATVAILQALNTWSNFLWPLMVTRGFDYQPLSVAMQVFFGQAPRQWGDIMAFASLATIPVLILFLIFQRYFVQSVASAGVKG